MRKSIVGFAAGAVLLLVLVGVGLFRIGAFKDDAVRELIPLFAVPAALHISYQPDLPDWEIEKIVSYDDRFASPTCEVYFANGIELLLSTSPATFPEMDRKQTMFGNNEIPIFISKGEKIYHYSTGRLHYFFKSNGEDEQTLAEKYLETTRKPPVSA